MYKPITLIIIVLILMSLAARAQNWREADSLHEALSKSSPDTTRVYILLNLARFEILKPGEFKTDLDSSAAYINQAAYLNRKINSIEAYGFITLTQGDLARERGQMPQGKALTEKAIQILSKGADKYHLGQAYLSLTNYDDNNNEVEAVKKTQIAEQAANIFKQGGYIERTAYSYKVVGDVDTSTIESLQYLALSLKLYQSIHYKRLHGLYDAIGATYLAMSNYTPALKNELSALRIAEDLRDTSMQLCEINNHLGIIYYKLLDYKQSLKYFNAALVTAERYKVVQDIYTLTLNIADAYGKLLMHKEVLSLMQHITKKYPIPQNSIFIDWSFATVFLKAYVFLHQFDLAKPYADHLLNVVNDNKNQFSKGDFNSIYSNLISYYAATKQYPRELTYLTKNDTVTRQLGNPGNIAQNELLWYKLDSVQHNYKDADHHLQTFVNMYRREFTADKNKQLKELQLQFDTQGKEDQIKLLNQRDALNQTRLQQETTAEKVTIGGTVLVLIIAGLLYRQSRLRKRNNELITHKNEVIIHKNELLQSLVTEKEWLLKEVHHRVKNNLHTVICLLESQAAYLENDALSAIEESQHRIYTMSLIHQKLYQSDEIKTIDMTVYVPELVQYLGDSFAVSGKIHFNLLIDPIQLNASQAIPLALIINEALTNSIKYAFPGNRRGEISIALTDTGKQYKLELADNGIGLPEQKKETNSLGLELMKGLSKEIMGEIYIKNNNGVKITVLFDHDALNDMDVADVDYLTSSTGEIDL